MNKPPRGSQMNANSLLLSCPPGTPNSTGSANGMNGMNSTNHQISLAGLQCLGASANSISPDSCGTVGQPAGAPVNLSHSSNTNFSNNQMNSPYQDHSELNSPLMSHSFNAAELAAANHLERLNGSLNSLGSNSSSSVNSNHSGSANSLLAFNGSTNTNLKKMAANGLGGNLVANLSSLASGLANSLTGGLSNGLSNSLSNGLANSLNNNSPTFTSNRENINCNNVQWIEFQMKAGGGGDNRLENVPTPPNSLSNASAFPPQSWRLGNLLTESNLCNANALALTANTEAYDYVNYTNV